MKYLFITLFLTIYTVSGIINQAVAQNEQVQTTSDKILLQLKNTKANTVFVAAHRGDWRNAPENSIQALENCIEMGVDIVETDVQLTKDSVLVIMHDETIDRTTTGSGKISDYTCAELQKFYLKAGQGHKTRERIPTFEEFMLAAKGKILINVDKGWNCLDKVVVVLKKTGTMKQALIKGKNPYHEIRREYGSLIDSIQYIPMVSEKTPDLANYVDNFLNNTRPAAFEVIFSTNDSPVITQLHKIELQGGRIWINSLWDDLCAGHDDEMALADPDANWGWIVKSGATFIQTDRPELLLNYLRAKGLHD